MHRLRSCLAAILCVLTLFAVGRTRAIERIAVGHGPAQAHRDNSFGSKPAPAPQLFVTAPTTAPGPTTIHAPAGTRSSTLARPSTRLLPGASAQALISHHPAPHLAATPLLI